MSITPTAQDLLRPEPKRDRWGRYVVAGVKGGKGKGYTRVTTLTKTCSDTFHLTEWAKRVVAVGVAKRPDLIAQAANLTADDKSELREIIAAAEEVGGANEKRRLGTALHKILEIIDLGGDANVPAELQPHVDAYREAMAAAGVKVIAEHTEQVFISDSLEYAGTADRIVTVPGFDLPLIADLKTGKDPLTYGAGEISMQLACYARAEHVYDYETEQRAAMPAVDQDWGLVMHLPARPGAAADCTLHLVNLRPGWAALDLALQVRKWRKAKGLHKPLADHTPEMSAVEQHADDPAAEEMAVIHAGWVEDAADAKTRLEDLVTLVVGRGQTRDEALAKIGQAWPQGVPGFAGDHTHTPDELDAINTVLTQLEAKVEAPFDPPAVTPYQFPDHQPLEPVAPAEHDNGGNCDNAALNVLRRHLDEMTPDQTATLNSWRAEGGWVATSPPCVRQYEITRAAWLASTLDDDTVRHLLAICHGEDIQPAVTTGVAIGALTIEQAQRFADLAQAVASGAGVVTFDGAGSPAVAAA